MRLTARPAGVHFSGHGGPGVLAFETDEGKEDEVPAGSMVKALRRTVGPTA